MRASLLISFAFALLGCAAQVLGPYSASLSQQDVQEIQRLVAARSDIHFKSVIYIHAVRPGRVYVEASDSILGNLIRSTFTARKRDGRWIIDEGSVQNYDQVIITS